MSKEIHCINCRNLFVRINNRQRHCCVKCRISFYTDKTPGHGPNGDCWLWTGGTNSSGYGSITINRRSRGAHIISYEEFVGPIPEHKSFHGMCVCHSCDNPPCVNPNHLFIDTHKGNMLDRDSKKRRTPLTGEKHGLCKLTDEDVNRIRVKYAKGNVTQLQLSKEFHVGHSQINRIVNKQQRIHAH